jgi:outer membrane protein OmpA-like peptidoglycan-associated protein
MNKILLVCLLLFCAIGLSAQKDVPKSFHALSARVLAIDHQILNDGIEEASQTFALELGYRRQFNKYLGLAIPVKVGIIDVGELSNITISGIEVLGQLYPLGNGGNISPYLHAGYGVVSEDFEDANHQVPLGLGFNIKLDGHSWFNIQGEYRLSDQDGRDNLMAGIGYVYRLSAADTDGDGIRNRDDQCPEAPGPASTNGCPDTDMDGVTDELDRCPTLPGDAQLAGCPDTDRDGVVDPDDECPETPGDAKTAGCPDADLDGVIDSEDKCPNEAGTAELAGCPDTDGDGTPDDQDRCPEQAGTAELMGCPDGDGDGIPDIDDKCPDLAGDAPLGCPDADGDGFQDADDACPNTPGSFNGCPDTDGDGVADDLDRCPSQPGPPDNAGCPVIEQKVQDRLEYAARAVQFETGSAQLKEGSYVILSEIAGIMREYRDYNLTVSGHTDKVGSDVNNLALSERRAEACRSFIVKTGIDEKRISSAGFGETQPVADNSTASGRTQNRRVAFVLVPGRRK